MRVGIIGGGAAGLAAAYELTLRGHYAQVLESAPFLGGQASTFDVGGGRLERGYHHLFVSDRDMAGLIEELGLGNKLAWLESKVGLYHGGKVWDFGTPMDPSAVQTPLAGATVARGLLDFLAAEDEELAKVRAGNGQGVAVQAHGTAGLRSDLGAAVARQVWRAP